LKAGCKDRDIEIHEVDIDREILQRDHNAKPLISDFIKKRTNQFQVKVWQGSIKNAHNPNFKDIDAVIAIELIEHVYPDVLDEIPYQIFSVIHPRVVILTTPNCNFNKLFNLEPGKFRHDDHKFEWNPSEFQDFCENICVRFPEYSVQIEGIGFPPDDKDINVLGCCSQMAIFIRNDFEQFNEEKKLAPQEIMKCDNYQLIHSIDYPVDTRDFTEKILDECSYHINRFKNMEHYANDESETIEIPVKHVIDSVWEITSDEEKILKVLREKFSVQNGLLIFPLYCDTDDSE
jgi:small RNA 2'-O-methyltransferase